MARYVEKYERKQRSGFKLIITAFTITLIMFIAMLISYKHNGGKFNVDYEIIKYVQSLQNEFLDKFFKIITKFGEPLSIIVMTILVTIILYGKSLKKQAVFFIYNVLGIWIFNEILKFIYKRERPIEKIIEQKGYSFPSGHAMVFMAFSIIIIYLLSLYLKNKVIFSIFSVFIIILSLLIGISRIYLRVHFFTDVIMGWISSWLWCSILILIYKTKYKKA